jgi:hypothetical protein
MRRKRNIYFFIGHSRAVHPIPTISLHWPNVVTVLLAGVPIKHTILPADCILAFRLFPNK